MKFIALPDDRLRRVSFYLAMEEYVARTLNDSADCFFMWQVSPSVIFGRNQLVENEVNLPYCQAHQISIYRRKSGGGCVYADQSNVMFSYITRSDNIPFTFHSYINMILLMLHRLGIDAHTSGRNDILIGQRKVSGNAFYHIPGHSIVHGTMLYDTNLQNMAQAITPSKSKLESKGVASVGQHVALLKDFTSLTLREVMQHARNTLCHSEYLLTPADLQHIESLEQEYCSDEFIYGHNPRCTVVRRCRFEGVGELELHMQVKGGVIKSINLLGDYFAVGDVSAQLLQPLQGCQFNRACIENALPPDLSKIILNLQRAPFIDFILEE